MFTVFLWMCIRMVETIEAHSGYRLPFSILTYLPFMLGQGKAGSSQLNNLYKLSNFGIILFQMAMIGITLTTEVTMV